MWVDTHCPRDAVFAMTDCGTFGYFSDRRVVNLDGLVNSLEYQEYGRDGRLAEFLAKCRVKYIMVHGMVAKYEDQYAKDQLRLDIPCAMYDRAAGSLRLMHRDILYSRTYGLEHGPQHYTAIRLWRYVPTAAD